MIPIDDQPISATFFGEGKWLTDFVTPDALEVQRLYSELTKGLTTIKEKIAACHRYVASEIQYKKFIRGRMWIEGRVSTQDDLWNMPSVTSRVGVGNCLGQGTKVLIIKDGRYQIKKIEELAEYHNYSVLSYNFRSRKVEPKPILGWFDNGVKEVVSVRFNNGETIRTTPDHRFFCDGSEIAIQDAIAGQADVHNIRRVPPLCYSNSVQSPLAHPGKLHTQYKYSPEHLWLVGMYLAEGYTGESHVLICNDDPKLLNKIENSLDTLKIPHSRTYKDHSNYIRLLHKPQGFETGIKSQKMDLDQLGHIASEKHLTPDFLSLNRNQLTEIMQGYCDGDGYLPTRISIRRKFASKHAGWKEYKYKKSFILQYGTASEELADQLKLIHLILGRPLWYNYQKSSHGAGKNPLPRHLMIEYKKPSYGQVDGFRDLGHLKIKEAIDTTKMPVYDLEVADNHNFMLANGTLVHNCANKSLLLTSLLRNTLPEDQVFCVLGNLYNGKPGGHSWVQVRLGSQEYIVEGTTPDVAPMISVQSADRYEAVHLFNDKRAYAIEGKTVMTPFTACYSTWLKDYLDWKYIEGRKREGL